MTSGCEISFVQSVARTRNPVPLRDTGPLVKTLDLLMLAARTAFMRLPTQAVAGLVTVGNPPHSKLRTKHFGTRFAGKNHASCLRPRRDPRNPNAVLALHASRPGSLMLGETSFSKCI